MAATACWLGAAHVWKFGSSRFQLGLEARNNFCRTLMLNLINMQLLILEKKREDRKRGTTLHFAFIFIYFVQRAFLYFNLPFIFLSRSERYKFFLAAYKDTGIYCYSVFKIHRALSGIPTVL
jgi:hypothetical protein